MNENTDSKPASQFTRARVGMFICIVGIILLFSGILLSISISFSIYLSNMAGAGISTTPLTYQIPNTISLTGVVTLLVGILVRYATNLFSKDGIWALQTGPYAR